MSKKNSQQKQVQDGNNSQAQAGKKPVDPLRQLRNNIRSAVREMYNQQNYIEKGKIYAKFAERNPDQSVFIANVIEDYAANLEARRERKLKQIEAQTHDTMQLQPQAQPAQSIHAAPHVLPTQPGIATQSALFTQQGLPMQHALPEQALPVQQSLSTQSPAKMVHGSKEGRLPFQLLPPGSAGLEEQLAKERPDNAILQDFKEYLAVDKDTEHQEPQSSTAMPSLDDQLHLLNLDRKDDWASNGGQLPDTVGNAVLLSPAVEKLGHTLPSQFALLGHSQLGQSAAYDPRVMLNTNIPFSAFICGLQGSGKSHTTSCIIENCSIPMPALGSLKKPLSTLVLHYNEYSSNVSSQPSETAFLSSVLPEYAAQKSVPVSVLVPPSNYHNLAKMYTQIPNVQVHPFRLQPRHLNISMMLSLMSMGKSDTTPLYMAQVTRVLREMAVESGGSFNYFDFRRRLSTLRLDRAQTPFLEQRLDLLDSYLNLTGDNTGDYFVDGGVTILDLSCPFMDQSTTCILFRVAIDLFLHAHPSRGKMIVADEAHKYMADTPAAKELTETFLNIIRQQRHLGVRTIISTQEPTISPRLIDLCSITIIHRFSSPEWWKTIQQHVPVVRGNGDAGPDAGLYHIASLRTGEALVFAPSAYLLDEGLALADTKHGTFKMRVRRRITWDGGRTIVHVR